MNRKQYTEAEFKAQKAREKEIDSLLNCESGQRSLEEVKEATIAELVFQREHRLGLYYLYGSDAFYTFCEALMCLYGCKEYERLMAEANKRTDALRSKYPM